MQEAYKIKSRLNKDRQRKQLQKTGSTLHRLEEVENRRDFNERSHIQAEAIREQQRALPQASPTMADTIPSTSPFTPAIGTDLMDTSVSLHNSEHSVEIFSPTGSMSAVVPGSLNLVSNNSTVLTQLSQSASQVGINSNEKEKAKWTGHDGKENTDSLIEILSAEFIKSSSKINGCSFKTQMWTTMTKEFNATRQMNYNTSQLQSRFGDLKKIWNEYNYLSELSGWSWDPNENKIVGSEGSITEFLEKFPAKKSFFKKSDFDFNKLSDMFR